MPPTLRKGPARRAATPKAARSLILSIRPFFRQRRILLAVLGPIPGTRMSSAKEAPFGSIGSSKLARAMATFGSPSGRYPESSKAAAISPSSSL